MEVLIVIALVVCIAAAIDAAITTRKTSRVVCHAELVNPQHHKDYIEVLDGNNRMCYIDIDAIDVVIENYNNKKKESEGVTIVAQGQRIDAPSTNYRTLINQL